MISTKDKLLADCHPSSNISWEEFIKDCEEAVNLSELHSDEWSSDDEALTQDKRNNKKRAECVLNTNSVIKVFDKK